MTAKRQRPGSRPSRAGDRTQAAAPRAARKTPKTSAAWKVIGAKGRLESKGALSAKDFQAIAATIGVAPVRARKTGLVAAKRAARGRTVETRWNGKETQNRARAGDWIVTSLSFERKVLRDGEGSQNTYVIAGDRFGELYEAAGTRTVARLGAVYRPKGIVSALHLSGGFDILAPWGERQTGRSGYLILNGEDVYGNNAETFQGTYEVLD